MKEDPIDANNHYIDGMKYLVRWLENLRSKTDFEVREKNSLATLARKRPRVDFMNYG